MEINMVGVDLAKNVFQVHVVDAQGRVVVQKSFTPAKFKLWIMNLPKCIVGMEACSGAHHWARELKKLGHEVRLIAPQFVKPFVKSNKNDRADAEAIVEAMSRPNMRFVAAKETWQQDILSLHRIRHRLVRNRTALINETRSLLYEYGITIPKGPSSLRKNLIEKLESYSEQLSPTLVFAILDLYQELKDIDARIEKVEKQIEVFFDGNADCKRVATISGVGLLTATALVATIGDPRLFKNGREFAAWLGLVPRQHSSGGKERLLGISKRGDVYLRTLMVHGARANLKTASARTDQASRWMVQLSDRKCSAKACVAVANKNARVAWALLYKKEDYKKVA